MVECTGLENRQGFVALREFESLRLLQIQKKPQSVMIGAFFMLDIYPIIIINIL